MSFGAFRGWTRDDPEWDADLFAIDTRPAIGTCKCCGHDICGSKGSYGGDAHYEFTDGWVCKTSDCYAKWSTEHSVDGSDEDVFCDICGENQRDWVYYKIDDEVVCFNCLDDWAEDYLEVSS